jgi:hypothetical protein
MRIGLEAPAELPDVLGDRDELARVFQNLIDNEKIRARRI